MGPLRLSDLVGLDTLKLIADKMFEEFKEPHYAPPPLLLRMVEAGQLGKKSGQGFTRTDACRVQTTAQVGQPLLLGFDVEIRWWPRQVEPFQCLDQQLGMASRLYHLRSHGTTCHGA